MIRAAVCDDEITVLDFLYEQISGEFLRLNIDISIEKFSSAAEFIKAHRENAFDAAFLDIKMPEIDGFGAASQIRALSGQTYIIFITTESTLVYDSFEFQPFNFIPKDSPDFKRRLKNAVTALAARLSDSRVVTLKLPFSEEISFKISELVCLKSSGNYTEYCFDDREPVKLRQKLDGALSDIDSEAFLRPHKSFAVNMNYIKKISFPKLIIYLISGEEIPISKTKKSDVEEQYSRYLRSSGGAR